MSYASLPKSQDLRDLTVDEAMERLLNEYLAEEKGRAEKTISDYRNLHKRWYSPDIGSKAVRRIDNATIDDLTAMRRAGLSASRLNHARSLYAPFFRWAKRRGITTRIPWPIFSCRPAPTDRLHARHQRSRK